MIEVDRVIIITSVLFRCWLRKHHFEKTFLFNARSIFVDELRNNIILIDVVIRCYFMLTKNNVLLNASSQNRQLTNVMLISKNSLQKFMKIVNMLKLKIFIKIQTKRKNKANFKSIVFMSQLNRNFSSIMNVTFFAFHETKQNIQNENRNEIFEMSVLLKKKNQIDKKKTKKKNQFFCIFYSKTQYASKIAFWKHHFRICYFNQLRYFHRRKQTSFFQKNCRSY